MNNIYLIGMPGSGKSTIAKILAKKLKLNMIDADDFLEDNYSISIPDIFALYGEDKFRQMETSCIKKLSQLEHYIISTGGGVVKRQENKAYLKNSGTVFFIDVMPQKILENSSLGGRPLLKDKNKIFNLYNERIDSYIEFCDVTVDNNGDIDTAVDQIINYLNRKD